jgi:hypothetical protein
MAWIKRNLLVVISAVIALALIVAGVLYLRGAMQGNKAMDDDINQQKEEVKRLMSEQHFPSPTNIAVAKRELQRVNDFIGEARKYFPPGPAPEGPLNDPAFASLLHNTVDNLTKEARASGIHIETNYHFSFDAEWSPLSFPPQSLPPLYDRLMEVKQISEVLFKAKVNRLEGIRRSRVEGELGTGPDYLNELPQVNPETGMMLWPYEVAFHSFSPELGVVLENLSRAPEAIVVRSVVVQPVESQRKPPTVNTNKVAALQTILDEHVLRIVMRLEVIKPSGPGGPGRPGGPGGPGGPGPGGPGGPGRNRGPGRGGQ